MHCVDCWARVVCSAHLLVVIDGKETHYLISSSGEVTNTVSGKVLKKTINIPPKRGTGYYTVGLLLNGAIKRQYVHRLVAIAFIENRSNLSDVNHKDGDKLNNDASNLEWLSHSENLLHAYRTGLHRFSEAQRAAFDKHRPPFYTIYKDCGGVTYNGMDAVIAACGESRPSVCMKIRHGKPLKKIGIVVVWHRARKTPVPSR